MCASLSLNKKKREGGIGGEDIYIYIYISVHACNVIQVYNEWQLMWQTILNGKYNRMYIYIYIYIWVNYSNSLN